MFNNHSHSITKNQPDLDVSHETWPASQQPPIGHSTIIQGIQNAGHIVHLLVPRGGPAKCAIAQPPLGSVYHPRPPCRHGIVAEPRLRGT